MNWNAWAGFLFGTPQRAARTAIGCGGCTLLVAVTLPISVLALYLAVHSGVFGQAAAIVTGFAIQIIIVVVLGTMLIAAFRGILGIGGGGRRH